MEQTVDLAAFAGTGAAMEALAALKARGITAAVMPTPRAVSASCGLSLRFSPADSPRVRLLLRELFPSPDTCRFYRAESCGGRPMLTPLPESGEPLSPGA